MSSNWRDEEMRQLFGGAGVGFVGACDELDSQVSRIIVKIRHPHLYTRVLHLWGI